MSDLSKRMRRTYGCFECLEGAERIEELEARHSEDRAIEIEGKGYYIEPAAYHLIKQLQEQVDIDRAFAGMRETDQKTIAEQAEVIDNLCNLIRELLPPKEDKDL